MIKAIIFDFYGVIYSDDLWRYVGEHDELQPGSDNVNTGRITWNQFRAEIASKMEIEPSDVDSMYEKSHINRQLVSMIVEYSKNYKIGLLTDANRAHIEPLLSSIGADKLFDAICVSSDVGITKPNQGAYKNALNTLGVEAEEAVFIDDSARNIDGAEEVGINGLLFVDIEQTKKALKVLLDS